MKLVKKFLLGLTAVALAAALVSCDGLLNKPIGGVTEAQEEDDDVAVEGAVNGKLITGQASNASIDAKNNGTDIIREVNPLLTKHYGSRAKIVQEEIDETKAKGMMGYAFNVTKYTDDDDNVTYDLSIVGATMYKGVPCTYISVFRNISKLNESNLGATDKHVYKAADYEKFLKDTEPCECEIVALPVSGGKATKNLDYYAYDEEAKTFTVCINVVAEENGSYTIEYYNPKDVLKENGSWISSLALKKVTDIEKVTIPASVTGYTKKTQAGLGVYANIYAGQSLKGSWRLSGIKGEAEVAEFED